MQRIGVISDTHGIVHPAIYKHFETCDQIWHAGDMGSIDVAYELRQFKPLVGVHGNIDGWDVRLEFPTFKQFMCEEMNVLMTHIGGYPGKYEASVRAIFKEQKPDIFICGHSHILKIIYDKKYDLLHINPGAAGKSGFHQVITFVTFEIDKKNVSNLKVIELPRYS